jgi:hypothetical protein
MSPLEYVPNNFTFDDIDSDLLAEGPPYFPEMNEETEEITEREEVKVVAHRDPIINYIKEN